MLPAMLACWKQVHRHLLAVTLPTWAWYQGCSHAAAALLFHRPHIALLTPVLAHSVKLQPCLDDINRLQAAGLHHTTKGSCNTHSETPLVYSTEAEPGRMRAPKRNAIQMTLDRL
jgi:hypothetical protein